VFRKFVLIGLVAGGILLGLMLGASTHSAGQTKHYNYVENSAASLRPNYYGLTRQVDDYFAKNHLVHSYLFKDLTTGTDVSSSPNELIISASLSKLPYVMDLYHLFEAHKLEPNQTVTIQPEWLDNNFGDLWARGAGSQITLGEAARLALVKSDNTAINIVRYYDFKNNSLDQSAMAATDSFTEINNGQAYVSAESYTAYLRCLYRACYLTPDDSEAVLKLLSQTNFPGIADGVPAGVTVAHKIGESQDAYSDCGIVYYPGRPYSLCVMIKLPPPQAQPIIKQLSSLTYSAVDTAVKQASH
jgi:beta-lactamase class A